MEVYFDDTTLHLRPSDTHGWGLSTAEVATGFGVTAEAIRQHKARHGDELLENKHWVRVTNSNAVGNQLETIWTKRGVVRLGFFINSERAKRFRDWAEDYVLQRPGTPALPALPQTYADALRLLADQVELTAVAQQRAATNESKALAYDQTVSAEGSYGVAAVAKMIGTGQNRLFAFMREHKLVFFREGHNEAHQTYVEQGWFVMRQRTYVKSGAEKSYAQLYITPKGVQKILEKWKRYHEVSATGAPLQLELH